jgi:hypothetical protein
MLQKRVDEGPSVRWTAFACLITMVFLGSCSDGKPSEPAMRPPVLQAQPGQTLKQVVDSLPAAGGSVVLGPGTWESGYEAGPAITKPNVGIYGSAMPAYNANYTALVGGTIVLGTLPVTTGADHFEVHDLGIDVGSAYVNAFLGGVATDGLQIINVGQVVGAAPIQSPVIENVACLGFSLYAQNHCMLVENVNQASIRNVQAVYNCHGLALKGTNSTVDGVLSRGHGVDSVLVKSDAYAPAANDTLSNIIISSLLSAGDSKGLTIEGITANLSEIAVNRLVVGSPLLWGVAVRGANPYVAQSVSISNALINYPGGSPSGMFCVQMFKAVSALTIQNLDCRNMWGGVYPNVPTAGKMTNNTIAASSFSNIANDAVYAYGSWTVANTTFSFVKGCAIVSISGVTTLSADQFNNGSGCNTFAQGGAFAQ